jgi:beta-glucuronidase
VTGTALAVVLLAAGLWPAAALGPTSGGLAERVLYSDASNGMYLLDTGWTMRRDPMNAGLRQKWQSAGATAGFKAVTVPNAFNARDLSKRSFAGSIAWYRVTFTTPHAVGVLAWRARFEGVNVDATAWLNGVHVGHHRGAYLPFEFDLDGLKAGTNELVVRVDSRGKAGDLPPANRERGWWNYGGIVREVYLRAVRTFDLSQLRVVANPADTVHAQVTAAVRNASARAAPLALSVTVDGPDGFHYAADQPQPQVGARQSAGVSFDVPIANAQLWTPKHPALYQLTIGLSGGQVVTTHFGVRQWGVSADGRLLLNGKPLALRGASFHEQTPTHGSALTPADRDRVVGELVRIRANFARQHYPPHPALLEAFDRDGIVFWEQIPVWRVREDQLRRASFRKTALSALRQAILRDRNHAAVVAWSVSNETLRGASGEITYFHAARRLVTNLDPTRLLAADKSLRPLNDLPRSYRLVDAIGLNEYVGWYGGRTSELPGNLAAAHRRFPGRVLVITEFGAEANRSGAASEKGTYAFQQRLIASHLGVFDRTGYLSGVLVWALRDFAARPGWTGGNPHPRPPILFKGLFKQSGAAKPVVAKVRRLFAAVLGD